MLLAVVAMRPRVVVRGSGALLAGDAEIAGVGLGGPAGALIAGAATVDGVGVSLSTGTGALAAQAATVAGESAGPESWAEVASWTHSGNVTTVDFTGLSGYDEFLVIFREVTLTSSGIRLIVASTDNGSTWLTSAGNYREVSSTGVEADLSLLELHATGSASARDGAVHILANNLAIMKTVELRARTNAPTAFFPSSSEINALRAQVTGGGQFSGGTIKVYAR